MAGTCAVCGVNADKSCGGCKAQFYCSKEHQRQHWKQHKHNCRPFKTASNNTLGRHLIATRDIKAGEVIFEESPLLIGPKVICYPTCLGCLRRLSSNAPSCSECGWPVCSKICELSSHHRSECTVLRKQGYQRPALPKDENMKVSAYCVVSVLRGLMLSGTEKRNFLELQSHLEERCKTELYVKLKTNLVEFLQRILGLKQYSENVILEAAAILDTNAFEIRRSEGCVNGRGLYAIAAMMSHDCKPNTKHVFVGPDFKIKVIATIPIKQGEIISATYTQALWGTLARRQHLRTSKCFDCTCARCSDPTEFKTYISALWCYKCKGKSAESDNKIISSDPLNYSASWKCESCGHTISAKQVIDGNASLQKEIASLDKSSPKPLEMFIKKYEQVLHPTNSYVVEVKYALSQIYGNLPGYKLAELSEENLDKKIDLCHELLDLAEILDPGLSRFRGMLLYDLQAAMAIQAKKNYLNDKITKAAAQDVMIEAMAILQKAAEILTVEPDMAEILKEKLECLAQDIDD